MNIEFTIPGAPVPKGRPRFARRGAFVTTYSPEKTVSYESLVKFMASQAMKGIPPIKEAVAVEVWLFVTPPASWSKKKTEQALHQYIQPTSKPDIDNVVKGLFDAMNGIVFADDKQVVRLTVEKLYSDIARARVTVSLTKEAD